MDISMWELLFGCCTYPHVGNNEHHLAMLILKVSIITSFYPFCRRLRFKLKYRVTLHSSPLLFQLPIPSHPPPVLLRCQSRLLHRQPPSPPIPMAR